LRTTSTVSAFPSPSRTTAFHTLTVRP
jgi:hypothetical protein